MDLPDPNAVGRRAGRWFAVGLCAAPVVDLADDAGLLGAIASFDGGALLGVPPTTWLGLTLFIGLGILISRLFAAHTPSHRRWFFAALLLPLAAYIYAAGFRLSTIIAVIALAFAYVSWRLGGEEGPAPLG